MTTQPTPREEREGRSSSSVDVIVQDLIVRRGLSYEQAIKHCERAAEEAAAPWHEAATTIRAWLEKIDA